MGRAQRTSYILDRLAAEGEVNVNVLAEELDVSPVTIRTTLKDLEDEGHLVRTHGGARPTAYPIFDCVSLTESKTKSALPARPPKWCATMIAS